MKLRNFFKSLVALPISLKALAKPPTVPPYQVWPKGDSDLVGLWVQNYTYDTSRRWNEPWFIEREFDEMKDNPINGLEINNWRRNKFWGYKETARDKTELLCVNRWDSGQRFFRNDSNIDWAYAGKGMDW